MMLQPHDNDEAARRLGQALFVVPTPPVRGIVIVNKKYLVNTLQKPSGKGQAAAIWESREKVLAALCQPN